jgi:hypothetical protein
MSEYEETDSLTPRETFSGPVIDRDQFPDANIPDHMTSPIPYFDVREILSLRDMDREPTTWRFWFKPERKGWICDGYLR